MTIVALIPARGGSKGIKNKNIVPLCGKPLIAYTIEAAKNATSLDHVIVSTDSPEIAEIARKCGAEVPFLRPAELSGDETPMLDVVQHALEWCEKGFGHNKAVVLLQPTSPLRKAKHIDEAVELFCSRAVSSVVSVVEVPHQYSPVSVMALDGGFLRPFLKDEKFIGRRQDKPLVFARNGPAVLVSAAATLRAEELYGANCIPYVMPANESLDIDSLEDLSLAEQILSHAD